MLSKNWLIVCFLGITTSICFGFDKYAGEFLRFGSNVREMSMGGASLCHPDPVAAPYWNPATLIFNERTSLHLMHAEEFESILKFDQFSMALPSRIKFAWGFSLFRLAVDDIPDTRKALIDLGTDGLGPGDANYPGPDPDGTEGNGKLDPGERLDIGRVGTFGASQSAFLISLAHAYSDKLALGLTLKQIYQSLYVDKAYGLGFDLAAYYKFSKHFSSSITLNNCTTTFLFWNKGKTELIPPSIRLGLGFNTKLNQNFHFFLEGGCETLFEGKFEDSDLVLGNATAVRFRTGGEIIYNNLIAIRSGRDDLGNIQVGLGIKTNVGNLDYGLAFGSVHKELGNSHRIALTFHIKELLSELKTRI